MSNLPKPNRGRSSEAKFGRSFVFTAGYLVEVNWVIL